MIFREKKKGAVFCAGITQDTAPFCYTAEKLTIVLVVVLLVLVVLLIVVLAVIVVAVLIVVHNVYLLLWFTSIVCLKLGKLYLIK